MLYGLECCIDEYGFASSGESCNEDGIASLDGGIKEPTIGGGLLSGDYHLEVAHCVIVLEGRYDFIPWRVFDVQLVIVVSD